MTLKQHERYRVRVKLRRGPAWVVRPDAEALDGRELVVTCAWWCDPGIYEGEQALLLDHDQEPITVAWIASGDVEVLGPALPES